MSQAYTIGVEFIETDPREAAAPAKKTTARKASAKKSSAKKASAKKASVKKATPDYSAMTLEELAIESGMRPDRVRESLAGLLMLGDTVAGIREHLLAKLANRNAKEVAKTSPAAKKKPAFKAAKPAPAPVPAPAKKKAGKKKSTAVATAAETMTITLPGGVELAMVRIPGKDYWMGKFPVTQKQWKAVMGKNPSCFRGVNRPVEAVSWNDCRTFLKKLNALPAAKTSGLVFRLPAKEEWEYACRAGATGDYCKLDDGTEITEKTLGEVAWFGDNSGKKTHPVGQKKPNAFGLYDMLGNVMEWTVTALFETRVFCGGSWFYPAGRCRASSQGWNLPRFRFHDLGFRLCADRRAD